MVRKKKQLWMESKMETENQKRLNKKLPKKKSEIKKKKTKN